MCWIDQILIKITFWKSVKLQYNIFDYKQLINFDNSYINPPNYFR